MRKRTLFTVFPAIGLDLAKGMLLVKVEDMNDGVAVFRSGETGRLAYVFGEPALELRRLGVVALQVERLSKSSGAGMARPFAFGVNSNERQQRDVGNMRVGQGMASQGPAGHIASDH